MTAIDLTEVGWDAGWAEAFARFAPDGLEPARVAIEFNHIFRLLSAEGEIQAQHSGRLLHRAAGRHELAAVGDWVAARRTPGEKSATIEALLPRRSKFSRKVAGELTEEQVVAANIDTVFVVMGLDHDYNPRRVERYVLLAYESGASPVVLLTKADLIDDVAARVTEISTVAPGTPVYAISVKPKTGVASGLEVITQHLGRGKTGALLGSSGVGKSTLVNALLGSELLKTAAVREADSRGRHTTRHRQMIVMPGKGLLIDTPGMRELQLWDAGDGAATETFDDIDQIALGCHFTNCRHREEPRCAVKAAVAEGALTAERIASFHKLQDELRALDAKRDARAQIDEKRRGRIGSKAIKQMQKDRGRE